MENENTKNLRNNFNENENMKEDNDGNINQENNLDVNIRKVSSSCQKPKIKTYPISYMKSSRNPSNSVEIEPHSSANLFKEKNSIFNIPGFMVNLDLEENLSKEKMQDYLNNSNLNKFTNEENDIFDLDESEIKYFKGEKNEINLKNKQNNIGVDNKNKSFSNDLKNNFNYENKSNLKTKKINIIRPYENKRDNLNFAEKNDKAKNKNEKEFSGKILINNLKPTNSNDNSKRNLNTNKNNIGAKGESSDYYVISDSFYSIDSFKIKKFKKNLVRNNVYFDYKSQNARKNSNHTNSLGFSQNHNCSAIYGNNNSKNKFNNSMIGEINYNKINNDLPKIGYIKDGSKQKSATLSKKFLSYILKVSSKLKDKESENIDEENQNMQNNNEYYVDELNENRNVDNASDYVRNIEYSGLSHGNEFSPSPLKIVKQKSSRNLADLYNEYKSHKNLESKNRKNSGYLTNKENNSNDKNNNNLNYNQMCDYTNMNFNRDFDGNVENLNNFGKENINYLYDKENYQINNYEKHFSNKNNEGDFHFNEIDNIRNLEFSNFQKIKINENNFDNYSNIKNAKENKCFKNINNVNDFNNTNNNNANNNLDNYLSKRQSEEFAKKMSMSTELKLITASKLRVNSDFLLTKDAQGAFSNKANEDNNKKNTVKDKILSKIEFPNKIKLADMNKLEEKVQFLKDANNPKYHAVKKYGGNLIKSLRKIDNETNLMIDNMDKNKFRSHSKINDLKILQGHKKINKSCSKFK